MVPARNLQLLRDAHGTPFAAGIIGVDAVTKAPPPSHMAQEPIDHHQEPSKQRPLPPQERQADQENRYGEAEALPPRPLQPVATNQEAAGTSGGGSSGNGGGSGDWLRLGLAPASPGAGSQPDLFADRAGRLLSQPRTEVLPGIGMPPGAFLRQAVPGIPQASISLPVPRAGPPWSPSAGPLPPLLPFAHRTFYTPGAGASGLDMIRVVLPPPVVSAAAGVWFALQAAPHQGRAPFLPQIPRSYLRIKDGRVTVRLLIKYLASKFGLEDEAQVEITCRGRPLLPFLTLQHVRDSIWCQGDAVSPAVAPDMSAATHLMVLQYGRRP
ncbi:protein LAX PANICLE 2-like [Phragmites australis]|uniref:protein LAX PANICLE 2-like n=1 Tax=Phragmites australis TaxID=29695 RepID=UPI002D77B378|nr:protein LAX PANICLE 2-like [Phragmites australis]